jgi:hypothetical protein
MRREAEPLVERVRVARVQNPTAIRERPVLDDLTYELDAEAAPAVLVENVDVGEIHKARRVTVDRPCESDLLSALVEPDRARTPIDQLVLPLARAPLRPIGDAADEGVDCLAVETFTVVVQLIAVFERAPHGQKPAMPEREVTVEEVKAFKPFKERVADDIRSTDE